MSAEYRKLVRTRPKGRNRLVSLPYGYIIEAGFNPFRELKGKWEVDEEKRCINLYLEYLD